MQPSHKPRSFNSHQLQAVREKLLQRKKDLWREVIETLGKYAGEEYQDLIQTLKDEGDVALAELRESTTFSLIELKAQELEMIEDSLSRVEKGAYGRCTDCGRWISPARLEIMPHALRCRDCQGKWEKRKKAGSDKTLGMGIESVQRSSL
jgi:DnaK suppressor protein